MIVCSGNGYIRCGVPQGLILVTLLFLIYITRETAIEATIEAQLIYLRFV